MNGFKKVVSFFLVFALIVSSALTTFCTVAYADKKDMSNAFKKVLNGGKLVLNSAPPADIDDQIFYSALDDFMLENPEFQVNIVDDSTTKIKLIRDIGEEAEESHVVEIVWKYNEKVLGKAKEVAKKLPQSGALLTLTDLEMVNYWVYYDPTSQRETIVNYSGELKALVENTNFSIASQSHGGAQLPFYTFRGGPAMLRHNKTTYYAVGAISARAQHIIYVSESTADTKQALLEAVQKRIDEYIGKGVIEVIATDETVIDYYNGEIAGFDTALEEATKELPKVQAMLDAENAKEEATRNQELIDRYTNEIFEYEQIVATTPEQKQVFIDDFKEGGMLCFLKNAVGGFIFEAKVVGKETSFQFVVGRDNKKLVAPSYECIDVETEISVSTDSAEVPLDTLVEVDKLVDGAEHDRICQVIGAKDNELFDIKLHSDSQGKHITKLKNGKFLVKIPIPEKFKGKNVKIVYVDANNTITEYEVAEKDGSACFETDHFSIYALTVREESVSTTTQAAATATQAEIVTTVTTIAQLETATTGGSGVITTATAVSAQPSGDTNSENNDTLWIVLLSVAGIALVAAGAFLLIKKRK